MIKNSRFNHMNFIFDSYRMDGCYSTYNTASTNYVPWTQIQEKHLQSSVSCLPACKNLQLAQHAFRCT